MRTPDWLKQARRRCAPELFVCKNHLQAKAVGVHPECLQVWDRAPESHEPYFVFAIHHDGLPRDASDFDIDRLQSMSSDREHEGRRGWIDDLDRGARRRFDIAEDEYRERVSAHFAPGGKGHERIQYMTKNKLVIAKTIPKNQGHLGRQTRPR